MKSKRSRLALIGVLALALSVTAGFLSGSLADAKKKGKGKKGGVVTVTKTTPTPIPVGSTSEYSMTTVPLSVGKKAKGKVVGANSVTITTTFTGAAGFVSGISAELTAPNGRSSGLAAFPYGDTGATTAGPLTETANSPQHLCIFNPAPPPRCMSGSTPETTVGRPYTGTIGNPLPGVLQRGPGEGNVERQGVRRQLHGPGSTTKRHPLDTADGRSLRSRDESLFVMKGPPSGGPFHS